MIGPFSRFQFKFKVASGPAQYGFLAMLVPFPAFVEQGHSETSVIGDQQSHMIPSDSCLGQTFPHSSCPPARGYDLAVVSLGQYLIAVELAWTIEELACQGDATRKMEVWLQKRWPILVLRGRFLIIRNIVVVYCAIGFPVAVRNHASGVVRNARLCCCPLWPRWGWAHAAFARTGSIFCRSRCSHR